MSDDPLAKNAAAIALGLIAPLSNDKTHFEALGRFLSAFANAEGASHVIARKLSGLSDEKARLVFGGMRLTDITDRIRAFLQLEGVGNSSFSPEVLKDIEACLDQLGNISGRRHNLVHRGATYFGGALISGNSMIAKTIANAETETIAEQTLNEMQHDCGAIFLRLIYIAYEDPQNASWLNALRLRPWHYKPPPPNNKNQRLPKDSESPQRPPPASRASRRREAMKKHQK
jgi:hypothetical protein